MATRGRCGGLRSSYQVQEIALDLKSAYDTVCHEGLLSKMRKMEIPDYLIGWTRSFLAERVGLVGAVGNPGPDLGLPWEQVWHRAASVPVSHFGEDRMLCLGRITL